MTESKRPDSDLADAVLAERGYRRRVRRLRSESGAFGPALVEELRTRSVDAYRQNPREAVERARLAALVASTLDDPGATAECFRSMAQAAILGGDHAAALRALDRALEHHAGSGDDAAIADLQAIRIHPLVHLERFAEARETGRRVLSRFEAAGDSKGEIRVRMALADLAFRQDRPREALRHYRRVESLLESVDAPRIRAAVAMNRANALEACHRFRAAARGFERAREMFLLAKCDHSVAQVEYNVAYGEMLRGRYAEALNRLSGAERSFLDQGDDLHLAHIDLDRAEIHIHLNMPEDAREFAERAIERFRRLEKVKECAEASHLAGRAAELSGDLEAAEEYYRTAGMQFSALGLSERLLGCVVQQAQIAERTGRREDAAILADQADSLLEDEMSPLAAASVELLHARLRLAAGDPILALTGADRALRACRRIHAPWVRIEGQRITGLAHAMRGEIGAAVLAFREAVEIVERYRGGVPPDEYMSSYLAGRADLYAELVDLLVAAGDTELAFEYTERAKSRALVDLLADRRGVRRDHPRGGPSARRVRYLRERLAGVYGKLFRSTVTADARSARSIRAIRRQACELENEISRLIRRNRASDREGYSLEAVDAPDLAAVREELEPDTVLLEFFFTGRSLLTFAVSKEEFHLVRQEATEEEVRRRLERFHFHLAKYDPPLLHAEDLVMRATRANLGELTELLLAPVEHMLTGKRLVIVPHGVLHYLPFHALPFGEDWLTDRFEVVYAPSAAVYGYCASRRSRADGPACVFGLPDRAAPQIAAEAERVGELLGSDRVYIGEEATFSRLREEASDARVIHIASHGMFRHRHPMLSSIRMADGWVNLYDLYSLNLNAELVVLSTCESGTADVTRGDEILGLNRGFLYAGAAALLTSQWRVNDEATSEFMKSFYGHLERLGNAATAHRAAMAEIREKRPHPYFWAPFFLTGRPVGGNGRYCHDSRGRAGLEIRGTE